MTAKEYAAKRQELIDEMLSLLNPVAPTHFYEEIDVDGNTVVHYKKGELSAYFAEGDKIAEQFAPRFDALRAEYKQSKNQK